MTINDIISNGLPQISEIKLLSDNDPMLKKKMPAFDFEKADIDIREGIANVMFQAMYAHNGIGLAANQIGLEIRAFSMLMGGEPQIFFNPVISDVTDCTIKMMEGCLTFPDLYLNISRPEGCRLNYEDIHGNRTTIALKDIEARCAMHELDHLNGVVFTSKVSKMQLKMRMKKIDKAR